MIRVGDHFRYGCGGVFVSNGGTMAPVWPGITAAFIHHVVFSVACGVTTIVGRA
jgi:hypothetical protein